MLLNSMPDQTALRRQVTLKLVQGLHIRACSRVVALASGFAGDLYIYNGDRKADARSMFDLVQLAAFPESQLTIEASGEGAADVLDQLESLFSQQTEGSDSRE
jgi:phosphotransferase system HPr (HPr) family protein